MQLPNIQKLDVNKLTHKHMVSHGFPMCFLSLSLHPPFETLVPRITLLRVIPTMTFNSSHLTIYLAYLSGIPSGMSSDILSVISSDILSGISSEILSGISSDILSGIAFGIGVEVRQRTLGVDGRG